MSHDLSYRTQAEELQRALASLTESDPAYAATLSDLAVLMLNKGEVAEAQRMFDRLVPLRAASEANTGASSFEAAERHDGGRKSSPQQPPSQGTKLGCGPGVGAIAESPSALPKATSRVSSSATISNLNRSTVDSSGGSSSAPAAQDLPNARPRGGAGAPGMAAGAAMFARALGGRPRPPRTRPESGSDPPGKDGPPSAAVPTGSGTHTSCEMSKGPAEAGPPSCSVTPAASLAAQSAERRRQAADAEGDSASVQAEPSKVEAAAAAKASGKVHGTAGRAGDQCVLPSAGPPAAVEVNDTWPGVQPGAAAGAEGAPQTADDAADSWEADEDEDPLETTPLAASAAATAAAPSPSASLVSSVADDYSAAAAAAVATMTGKPPAWGLGGGGAGGGRQGSRPSNGRAGTGAGAGAATGSGRATAVQDFYLEPRGDTGEDDPAAAQAAAALRASLGECRHVLEVYGLTTEIRTTHLQEFVSELAAQDGRPLPVIKWVDDQHALLVCPDGATAEYLLQVEQDLFRLRPFTEASAGSQAVAATDLLPPRERPKTTVAVAKRLLSHALGMSQLRDREAERDLAEQRRAAREARQERERKLAAAWDDD